MQTAPPNIPEDAAEIAENIRSGEFFREAMQDYHARYNDLISERYFYLGVTALTLLMLLLSLIAMVMLQPLKSRVPVIYSSENVWDDLPSIKKLGNVNTDPNVQLKRFLLANYVKLREEYSIETVERNANGVKSQSTEEVYDAYQQEMDPRNPASPIAQFERQSIRQVTVTGFQQIKSSAGEDTVNVNFTATVTSPGGKKITQMRAIISFRFDNIEVNQKTGETTPLNFIITQYQSEILGT